MSPSHHVRQTVGSWCAATTFPASDENVPAVALSAYARDEDKKRSFDAGFDIHLSKPVSSEELISALLGVARKSLGKAG